MGASESTSQLDNSVTPGGPMPPLGLECSQGLHSFSHNHLDVHINIVESMSRDLPGTVVGLLHTFRRVLNVMSACQPNGACGVALITMHLARQLLTGIHKQINQYTCSISINQITLRWAVPCKGINILNTAKGKIIARASQACE